MGACACAGAQLGLCVPTVKSISTRGRLPVAAGEIGLIDSTHGKLALSTLSVSLRVLIWREKIRHEAPSQLERFGQDRQRSSYNLGHLRPSYDSVKMEPSDPRQYRAPGRASIGLSWGTSCQPACPDLISTPTAVVDPAERVSRISDLF